MNRKTAKNIKITHKDTAGKGKQNNSSDYTQDESSINGSVDQDIKSDTECENRIESEDKSVEASLNLKLEEAELRLRETQDKYLRLSAEFDNYRKRTLKEKSDLIRYANEDLLKNILSIMDDFERGIQIIDQSEDIVALKSGIHLIYNKFSDFTKQNGIKEIQAKDQPFDIDFHEAMTKIPAPSEALKGKVVDVIEKGYMLGDKVIRYAKVVVGE
jgi:molecular chaperone GrpE